MWIAVRSCLLTFCAYVHRQVAPAVDRLPSGQLRIARVPAREAAHRERLVLSARLPVRRSVAITPRPSSRLHHVYTSSPPASAAALSVAASSPRFCASDLCTGHAPVLRRAPYSGADAGADGRDELACELLAEVLDILLLQSLCEGDGHADRIGARVRAHRGEDVAPHLIGQPSPPGWPVYVRKLRLQLLGEEVECIVPKRSATRV